MKTPPEKRKARPSRGELREVDFQSSNNFDNNSETRLRQAARIRSRFLMSAPLALVTATLAYGGSA